MQIRLFNIRQEQMVVEGLSVVIVIPWDPMDRDPSINHRLHLYMEWACEITVAQ